MNSLTISLSSPSPSYTKIYEELYIEDLTNVTVSLSGMNESILPLYMTIDWGDGNIESFDNDVYKNYRTSSIFAEVISGKFSSIFQNTYQHKYFPSPTTLYKSLTSQVMVEYCNGSINWFIIPMKIRTYDYFESISDLTLINTNILPESGNPKEHQFLTDKGGFLIESRN